MIVALLLSRLASSEMASASVIDDPITGGRVLTLAIALAALGALTAIYYAFHMAGSTVGDVMRPISFGMIFMSVGLISNRVNWADPEYQRLLHDAMFVFASALILLGVSRLRKLVK